jgi:REP element-mobilizing transposase RayT
VYCTGQTEDVSTAMPGTLSAWPGGMTAPRQVLPGTTYLVTRRCSHRQFLLRPSPLTNSVFLYVLAVASCRFGVHVHAYCVLSNHFHLVVTDPGARLPAFEQYLDSLVARAVNSSLGRWESFWAPSSYSAVALVSRDDIVDKAAYVLANPTAAGLVPRGRDWPGLWSAPEKIGAAPIAARRPATFFRSNGYMPETATLELTAPPGFDSPGDFGSRLALALVALEEKARRQLASGGRGFLGAARVLAQKPWARPAPGEPRRQLKPRVASRDKWKRIEVLTRLLDFLGAYREAWLAMRAGATDVLFPAGTYGLRVTCGVRCAAPT